MKSYILFGIIFFFCYSFVKGQNNDGMDGLHQRLEIINEVEPHSLLAWGTSYETVLDSIYTQKKPILTQSKDEGKLVFVHRNFEAAVVLQFKSNLLAGSLVLINISKDLSTYGIYYAFVEAINKHYKNVKYKEKNKKPYAEWRINKVLIQILIEADERRIIFVTRHSSY